VQLGKHFRAVGVTMKSFLFVAIEIVRALVDVAFLLGRERELQVQLQSATSG